MCETPGGRGPLPPLPTPMRWQMTASLEDRKVTSLSFAQATWLFRRDLFVGDIGIWKSAR